MVLGFKRCFAQFVWDGSKTHTIRAKGGRDWRPGRRCDCYIDTRQKTQTLLGRWECVKVEDVCIRGRSSDLRIFVDEFELSGDERNDLAWRDGFRSRGRKGAWQEFCEYWAADQGNSESGVVYFEGEIIHWKFTKAGRAKWPKQLKKAA